MAMVRRPVFINILSIPGTAHWQTVACDSIRHVHTVAFILSNAPAGQRGLGDENSLTVLNGQRTIGYPVPDGTGWNRVDINSLVPRIAVQRVELLLDGGSAIFGSDPVAGVANFVTKNNFRGFDFSFDNRMLDEKPSAANATIAALFGAGNDDTNFVAALEYHAEEIVMRRDIDDAFEYPIDVNPDSSLGLENQQGFGYISGGGMTAVGWVDPLCGDPMFGEFSYYPAYVDPADHPAIVHARSLDSNFGFVPGAPAMGMAMARPPPRRSSRVGVQTVSSSTA